MLVFWISGRLWEVVNYQTGMITDRGSTLFGSRIAGWRVPAIPTNVYFSFLEQRYKNSKSLCGSTL